MKNKALLVIISVACLILLISGLPFISACSSTPSQTTAATQTTQAAPQEKILKIGTLVPLQLKEGTEIQRWMDLFTKVVNEKGGWKIGNDIYKIQSIVYDGGINDVAKARAAAERLVLEDGVKFMVSNWGDIPSQTATITEPNKVLVLGCDFADETVMPGYDYFIRASGVYFGRGLSYVIQKDMVAKGATTEISINAESQQGEIANALWGAAAKLAGMNVLPGLLYPADTVDFSSVATKLMSLEPRPDLIELSFVTGDQITGIISALHDAGYEGFISPMNMNPNLLDNCIAKVGKEYMEGWECLNFDPRGVTKDPEMLALIDRYTQEYGEFRAEGAFWVGPWFLFQDAVKNTNSVDVEVIKNYLQNSKHGVMTLDGFSQLFARPDVENYKTIDVAPGHGVGIIRDGKLELLKTVSVKDQYLVSIKVYGLADVYQKYWDQYGKPTFPDEPSLIDFADLNK